MVQIEGTYEELARRYTEKEVELGAVQAELDALTGRLLATCPIGPPALLKEHAELNNRYVALGRVVSALREARNAAHDAPFAQAVADAEAELARCRRLATAHRSVMDRLEDERERFLYNLPAALRRLGSQEKVAAERARLESARSAGIAEAEALTADEARAERDLARVRAAYEQARGGP